VTDAIVLCGGASTRVRELTQDKIPKILLSVIDGVPFIDHLVDTLLMQNIRSIVFAAGVHGEQVVDYLETKLSLPQRRYGFFQAIVEDFPHGTAGAIKCALDNSNILSQKDKTCLIVNGDSIVFHPRCLELPQGLSRNYIWGTQIKNDGSFGSISVDEESAFSWKRGANLYEIKEFSEKVVGSGWISNGWYSLDKSLFDDVPEVCSLEYDLLPRWVKEHRFLLVETHPGDKVDIGTTERIRNLKI
jgi:NDP-sugar pyrophosphorylase family protein